MIEGLLSVFGGPEGLIDMLQQSGMLKQVEKKLNEMMRYFAKEHNVSPKKVGFYMKPVSIPVVDEEGNPVIGEKTGNQVVRPSITLHLMVNGKTVRQFSAEELLKIGKEEIQREKERDKKKRNDRLNLPPKDEDES